jgi:hypothetical protein
MSTCDVLSQKASSRLLVVILTNPTYVCFNLCILRDAGPCVVTEWRFGRPRPVPIVETTFTRPNPVGGRTKCRVDTSVLSLRHTKQAIWTAAWIFLTREWVSGA